MTLNAAHRYHVLDHLDTYVLYEVTVRARNSLGVGEVALVEGGSRTLQGGKSLLGFPAANSHHFIHFGVEQRQIY